MPQISISVRYYDSPIGASWLGPRPNSSRCCQDHFPDSVFSSAVRIGSIKAWRWRISIFLQEIVIFQSRYDCISLGDSEKCAAWAR